MTILGVALGSLGIAAGLSLVWAVLAIVIGNAIGTVFMAAHSAQGPQLGIPQMIQSRAQFGVRGAGLPLAIVVITYLLYCAANGVLIQGTIMALVPIGNNSALVLYAVATLIVAFIGYELIHRLGAVLTVISATLFVIATGLLISGHSEQFSSIPIAPVHFSRSALILTMTQTAAWSLSYGPYVADYSRYLPPNVPTSTTFWYTAFGCWLSSSLIMAFGAYLATIEPELVKDPGNAIANLFGPARPIVQLMIIVGVVQGNVMNLYSAYMSVVTIVTGLRKVDTVGKRQKLLVMTLLMIVATSVSTVAQKNFDAYFADMLNAMIYMLVPWSAINLADYYVIHKGRYNIPAMFQIDGEYGAYRWKTIAVYVMGIIIQQPFVSLSFYKGPIAHLLGADIAWIPGLVVPGILHIVVERSGVRSSVRNARVSTASTSRVD